MTKVPGAGCDTLLAISWLNSWLPFANVFGCGASSQVTCKGWRPACSLSLWAALSTYVNSQAAFEGS